MKLRKLSALLLAFLIVLSVFSLAACSNNGTSPAGSDPAGSNPADTSSGEADDPSPVTAGDLRIKFFKAGRAGAVLVRTQSATVLINTGDVDDEETRGGEKVPNGKADVAEKILEYLQEKQITRIDYLVVTQFNKNYIGGVPTLLGEIAVDHVIQPSYNRDVKTAYQSYKDAIAAKNLTPESVSAQKELKLDDLTLTFYPNTLETTSASLDEFNSLVVSVETKSASALITSDIFGARTSQLIKELNGKKFDILQIPSHGEYNDTVGTLIEAVAPKYAILFTSTNNPADVRTTNLLNEKSITSYLTKNGSVEAKYKNGELTVKQ